MTETPTTRFAGNAIVQTRREYGTETAKEAAFHRLGSNAISAYDHAPLADLDVTAMRLEEVQLSRDATRRYFSRSEFSH
jgi:hypothetical protein